MRSFTNFSMDRQANLVILVLIILLPIQAGLAGLYGMRGLELWPSVTMPGFRAVYSLENGVTLRKSSAMFIDSNGAVYPIDWTDFLADIPPTHHKAAVALLFDPVVGDGSRQLPVEWLRHRADELTGPGRAMQLIVVWHEVRIRRDVSGVLVETVLTDSIAIPIRGDQYGSHFR